MREASGGNEAASCGQVADRFRTRSDPFRDTRPGLRSAGPGQRGRAVPCDRPVEPTRHVSIVGPGSPALGREEALRTLVPCCVDRAHRRLSAPQFVDATISGIPFQVVGRMEGPSQEVAGEEHRTAEENPARTEEGTAPSERI